MILRNVIFNESGFVFMLYKSIGGDCYHHSSQYHLLCLYRFGITWVNDKNCCKSAFCTLFFPLWLTYSFCTLFRTDSMLSLIITQRYRDLFICCCLHYFEVWDIFCLLSMAEVNGFARREEKGKRKRESAVGSGVGRYPAHAASQRGEQNMMSLKEE